MYIHCLLLFPWSPRKASASTLLLPIIYILSRFLGKSFFSKNYPVLSAPPSMTGAPILYLSLWLFAVLGFSMSISVLYFKVNNWTLHSRSSLTSAK